MPHHRPGQVVVVSESYEWAYAGLMCFMMVGVNPHGCNFIFGDEVAF